MSRINLLGKRFTRLVVLEEVVVEDKHHHRKWKCSCDCGKITYPLQQSLLNGSTKSCGCLAIERSIESTSVIDSGFRSLWCRYKSQAEERNLSWELTKKQFKELTQSPCYYTGRPPSNEHISAHSRTRRNRGLAPKEGGIYTYNGVDRLDSSIGYTVENCVSCCESANLAKQSLSHDDFIAMCKEIAVRH